jgi:hypothetical protein
VRFKVILLRERGRRLSWREAQNRPSYIGQVTTHLESAGGEQYRVTTLRPEDPMAPALIPPLYEAALIRFATLSFRLRGFERLERPGGAPLSFRNGTARCREACLVAHNAAGGAQCGLRRRGNMSTGRKSFGIILSVTAISGCAPTYIADKAIVPDKIAKQFQNIPLDERYSYSLLDVLVSLRNDLAHGTYMLAPNMGPLLNRAAEIINQLFPSPSSSSG